MWHCWWLLSVYGQKLGCILSTLCLYSLANTLALTETCLTCVRVMIGGREWKRGRNSERGVKAFCAGAPAALHIFHFPPSWKDQVIEKETIQQPRLHRCQWKASEILEYYTLGPAFVFLSHGAYGEKKKRLYNDNTWKVFPHQAHASLSAPRWNRIVSLWMGDVNGETAGWREKERDRERERKTDVVCPLNAEYIEM